jgi:hypothetical protein
MAQLFLPVEHTEADLVLAGQIAERVDSAELYVAWTAERGTAVPEVMAELREQRQHWTDTLAVVFQAVRELWTVLLARDAQRPARPAAAEHPAQAKHTA